MHIYIQLMEDGYQRSFSFNFGGGVWHWYRSSLRRKATEATESDLGLLLRFWALFLTQPTTGVVGIRYVFSLALIHYISFIRGNCSVCAVTRQLLVSVLVPEDYWDPFRILPADTNTLHAICMCSPGDARQPAKCFCQDVTNLTWTKPRMNLSPNK